MAASQKLLSDLSKIRTKIATTKSQLLDLDREPIAPGDVADRVDLVIQHLAGRFDAAWVGSALSFPELDPSNRDDILAEACTGGPSPGVLLAWLFPDLLRERLTELVIEHADGTVPLADRPAERQRLEQDLYSLEVQEENLVVACEESGLEVFRRPDADPSIILALET